MVFRLNGFKKLKRGLNAFKDSRFVLMVLTGLFLFGMIYGVFCFSVSVSSSSAGGNEISRLALSLVQSYSERIFTLSPLTYLMNAMSGTMAFLIAAYLLGYSAISQPLILLLLPLRGLGLGFFMAGLYSSFGFKGISFCALVLLPNLLISLFCIVFASKEAFSLSNMFFGCISFSAKKDKAVKIEGESGNTIIKMPIGQQALKLYNLKMGILFLLLFGGAIVELICFLLFGNVLC